MAQGFGLHSALGGHAYGVHEVLS